MKDSVFFSVIIPTYNRAGLLKRAIESVLTQEFSDLELIVIDDGSTDRTGEMVTSMTDQRVRYKQIQNSERGAARNVGIELSGGRYVTFLDSDDLFYRDHLFHVHERLIHLGLPELYHQAYVIVNPAGRIVQRPYRGNDLGKTLFRKGNVMSCMGVFVRNDISKTNLFQESRVLAGLEDWELWIRLASQFKIHYDRKVTGALVDHGSRSTVQVDKIKLEEKCKMFLDLVESNPTVRSKYRAEIDALAANVYTYLSLHLSAISIEKRSVWKYLRKGIRRDNRQLLRRRTLVILRNLMFI